MTNLCIARSLATGLALGQAAGSGDVFVPRTNAFALEGDPVVDVLLELWSLGLLTAVDWSVVH